MLSHTVVACQLDWFLNCIHTVVYTIQYLLQLCWTYLWMLLLRQNLSHSAAMSHAPACQSGDHASFGKKMNEIASVQRPSCKKRNGMLTCMVSPDPFSAVSLVEMKL